MSSSSILISPFDITAAFFHRLASQFIIASWKDVTVSVGESTMVMIYYKIYDCLMHLHRTVYRLFVVAFRRSFYYEYLPVLYGFDAAIYWSARGNACLRKLIVSIAFCAPLQIEIRLKRRFKPFNLLVTDIPMYKYTLQFYNCEHVLRISARLC